MCDIIDFVIENATKIESYEITYYKKIVNDEAIGEINFILKNGDSENFFIC